MIIELLLICLLCYLAFYALVKARELTEKETIAMLKKKSLAMRCAQDVVKVANNSECEENEVEE